MIRKMLVVAVAALSAAPASAAVSVEFYSRELGLYFPHAFIVTSGHMDSDPRPVDASYGWVADSVSPAILNTPAKGSVQPVPSAYLHGSQRQFTVIVTDAQYARIRQLIASWNALPQPSYSLHNRNCIHFVQAIARDVGLRADDYPKLMTKPHAYLAQVQHDNPVLADGSAPVTTRQIAAANAGTVPQGAPALAATTAAAPAPARTSSVPAAPASQASTQRSLSAAAIAAGYRADNSTNR